MHLNQLLTPSRTLCHSDVVSKKRALELASEVLADQFDSLSSEDIFAGLLNRERLGSTGIGDAIAIPHCRLPGCTEAVALLMTLAEAIDFDAIDNQPVDILCFLLVPQEGAEEHLQTLASLAELFSNADMREKLRTCSDSQLLFDTAVTLSSPGE